MLDIITNYTIEDCNRLSSEVGTLRAITGEVEGVRTALYALTEMDSIISRLGTCIAELGNEGEILKQMAQGLDKINLCYQSGENRICSYAECGVISFTPKELKTVNLAQIADML